MSEYSWHPVDIVALKKHSRVSALAWIMPRTTTMIRKSERDNGQLVVKEEVVRDPVQVKVVLGKWGWYADFTDPKLKWTKDLGIEPYIDENGKAAERERKAVLYNINFVDCRGRGRTKHVLAGVAAMVAKALGSDHRANYRKEMKPYFGCHNCWNRVPMYNQGDPNEEISTEEGDVEVISNDVRHFCQTVGVEVMTEYKELIAELEVTEGDRYKNLHNFKGKYEVGGRLVDAERLFEECGTLSASLCNGCHVLSTLDTKKGGWILGTPRAANVHFTTEEVELSGKDVVLPMAQIGGMRIRCRWWK